jgi:mannose/fructose/N-acetylgalactosamine-specific phosphotransferase system component IID
MANLGIQERRNGIMNALIEGNRRLLSFYRIAARALGWVLICGGTIWLLLFVLVTLVAIDAAGSMDWPHASENFTYASVSFVFESVMPGLIALLVGQLMTYMLQSGYTPSWLFSLEASK